jgi:HPt (histidine-containing phosphotransfer) domain-containing protein
MAGEAGYLLELVGGDKAVARDILADFLRSDATDRAGLAAAVTAGSADDVFHHAHRIKGAARAIGALEHAARAGEIEIGATTGADLGSLMAALEATACALALWEQQLA